MTTKKSTAAEDMINVRRAYTTGGKLGARQMFVFNEDGTIAGLKQVEPKKPDSPKQSRTGSTKDKKFGKLSANMSVSGLSIAESKVAFSDANYMPEDGQTEGARIGKMMGKPGVTKCNLLLVPIGLFLSTLTATDIMQSTAQILQDKEFYPQLT